MVDPNALNQAFKRYDQVEKSHTYRLAEHSSDAFDEDYEVATLDFGQYLIGDATDKSKFAEEFGAAVQEIGFAVLTGHGVDTSLYDEMHDLVIDLFESMSLDEKMRFRAQRHGSVNQGYFPLEETSDIHPDQVEGWVFCRHAFDLDKARSRQFQADAFWPDARFEREFRRLVLSHEQLFIPIAQAMLRSSQGARTHVPQASPIPCSVTPPPHLRLKSPSALLPSRQRLTHPCFARDKLKPSIPVV